MKFIKFKFLGFITGVFAVYFIFILCCFENYIRFDKNLQFRSNQVVIHLDLKGSPPKLNYLASLLPLLKRLGVSGLLMQYEDTFPYQGTLANLSSTKPYDKTKLRRYLTQANNLGIEIIPLIQTFGHMEHVLKLKQYEHLREVKEYPDSICPSNDESISVIKDMLQQVIHLHSSIAPLKHIHIGCDEVYQLNKCNKCLKRKLVTRNIFTEHVRVVKALVYGLNPSITVLVWDDMFRSIKSYQWNKTVTHLHSIEPVYWDYTTELERVYPWNINRYHKSFKNVWIASAYKGADGIQADLPILLARFLNHYRWMNFTVTHGKEVYNPKGIILTGWSRYKHFEPMCELLPAALPSLVMNLLVMKKFREGISIIDILIEPYQFFNRHIASHLEREFNCKENILNNFNVDVLYDTCKHKYQDLTSTIKRYVRISLNIDTYFRNHMSISLIEYYSQYRNLDVHNAHKGLSWCKQTLKDIKLWKKNMTYLLMPYYEDFVINEYIGYKTNSMKKQLSHMLHLLQDYLKVHNWDRRSYNFTLS